MKRALVLLLCGAAVVGAATRRYEIYQSNTHGDLPFSSLKARVPPQGLELRPATQEVVNPEDESDQTWRARAGIAKARYVLKGKLLFAALPTGSGVDPYEHHLFDLTRLDDQPEPLSETAFAAKRLVILAPYDVERRRYSIEVFLGDSDRDWFPLTGTAKDPKLRTTLRTLLAQAEGLAQAPTWGETAVFLDQLRAHPGLLYGLYLESFGKYPPKPEPRRR